MITVDDVRRVALELPRAYEALIHDRIKFKVRSYVFCAFSRDETLLGFGFPREERAALVASEPEKFLLPPQADLRYHWVMARVSALDVAEMTELVTDGWAMCVPKSVREEWFSRRGPAPPAS